MQTITTASTIALIFMAYPYVQWISIFLFIPVSKYPLQMPLKALSWRITLLSDLAV